ncbi:MAG: hypothetical protein Q9190_001394 [Brigantiaea leucoxantha]
MRPTPSSLASLTPHVPTGLTGLFTHPLPRPHLLYLYTTTLTRLRHLPDHSVYRQSTEALTNHRLNIVRSVKPPGYQEWAKRAEALLEQHPNLLDGKGIGWQIGEKGQLGDEREQAMEWDGERIVVTPEGTRSQEERAGQVDALTSEDGEGGDETEAEILGQKPEWEPEPSLEKEQVMELEERIGQGLIEEVIRVAQGELKLVDTMLEHKVWEELEEHAPEGLRVTESSGNEKLI